jgi:hypothetical protein
VLDALVDRQDRDVTGAGEAAVVERSLSFQTRSTKSGPGRWSCSLGTVWQTCSRRSRASSPNASSIFSREPLVTVAIIASYTFD